MKKSSFLHNPKDMLSKSFNPAKCKTALKLAASRMKLMKNKKEAQVKQMKRELAQLLESGQDQTARIRVEHVIREEKMMAAYDLIDIYCELIVARLPIIESQKNCPIDLKEAITSVIFASPRCGDIPELVDARKHFTAKYGKDFVSAAIEIRPNCGVSRLLVEKLSANAPDGQTKIKVLTAIAEEHNIKWDPKSFGQSDMLPPNDLLNGPSTFEKSSAVHAEAPPHVTPDVQAPPSYHVMDNQPVNFSEQKLRSSQETQHLASRQNTLGSNRVSSIPQAQMRPSGIGADRGEVSQSFEGERNTSFTRQSWDMEFKDATSAAKAAAESAERASIAARAAAELSSRGRAPTQPQYSSEVHNSVDDTLRDERTAKHMSSKYNSDYLPKDPANSSSSDRQPRFQNKPMDRIQQDDERYSENSYHDGHDNGKRYGHFASSRSQASFQNDTSNHSVQIPPDDNSQKSLSKEEEIKVENSMQKQSDKSQIAGLNHLQEGFRSENIDYSGEDRSRKQSSFLPSSSHSSISSSDDRYSNSGHHVFGYDAGEDRSIGIDLENNARETSEPSYHASAAPVIFDDSDSDDDTGFDTGFRLNEESNFHYASPGRNSPPHLSNNRGNESLKFRTGKSPESSISEFSNKKYSIPEFSESLEAPVDSSQADNFGSVTFDESDDADSETEINMLHSGHHGTQDSRDLPTRHNKSHGFSERPVTFDDSDDADSETEINMLHSGHHGTEDSRDLPTRQNKSHVFSETDMRRNESYRTETVVESSEKFGFGDSPISQSSFKLGKSHRKSSNAGSESSFYNPVDEVEYLDASVSKVSLVHEVKDNVDLPHLRGRQMDDESSDDSRELNFNRLTGGFRQKGYTRPPYTRSQVDDISSSSKEVSEDIPNTNHQSAEYSTVESFANTGKNKGVGSGRSSRLANYHSDSDSDSSVEEFRKQPASRRQDQNIQHAGKEDKKQSRLRGSVTYFDSESSDSEDDSAQQVFRGRSHLGSGLSWRTKAPPSSSSSVFNSKGGASSGVPVNTATDSGVERNPNTRFYGAKTPREPQSRTRNSDRQANSEQPSSTKVASSPSSVSKISLPEENRKSSGVEQPPNYEQKVETSRSRTRNSDQQVNSERPLSPKVASKTSLASKKSLPKENRKSSEVEQLPSSERKVETSRSQTRNSDQKVNSERPLSPQVASKTSLVSKISLPEENRKSSGVEQLPSSERKVETSRSQTRNSDRRVNSERPLSPQVASKTSLVSKISLPEENRKSSGVEQLPSSERKVETSRSQTRNSDRRVNSERPLSPQVASKTSLVSKTSLPEENRKSSGVEQPPGSERKVETSHSTENRNTASGSTISREDSLKKASHVHPKLPDYDTLAARIQALRMNDQ